MFNLAQYLEKFKNIGQGERFLKQTVSLVIKEVLNIDIDTQNIIIKNAEITFKVSPALKNTIYINKEKILAKIKEKNSAILNDIK